MQTHLHRLAPNRRHTRRPAAHSSPRKPMIHIKKRQVVGSSGGFRKFFRRDMRVAGVGSSSRRVAAKTFLRRATGVAQCSNWRVLPANHLDDSPRLMPLRFSMKRRLARSGSKAAYPGLQQLLVCKGYQYQYTAIPTIINTIIYYILITLFLIYKIDSIYMYIYWYI